MKKRLLALVLILCAIITVFPVPAQAVQTVSTVEAQAGLDRILREYPDGSFFTANGKACTIHGIDGSCSNCSLTEIYKSKGMSRPSGQGDAHTCVAFAAYIMNQVFGVGSTSRVRVNPTGSSTSAATFAGAAIGDLILFYSKPNQSVSDYSHVAICMGTTDDSIVLYECNATGTVAQVSYRTIPYSRMKQYHDYDYCAVFRASNYTPIKSDNKNPDVSTPTCTQHIQGSYLFYEAAHPHLNYFACTNCGEAITDGSTVALDDCDECNHPSGTWSGWYDVVILPFETDKMKREVETRQVEGSSVTEYRYVGYATPDGAHEAWCETYLRGLFGSAVLRYSDWSTTRYPLNGEYWTCGHCSGPHMNVHYYDTEGRPRWGEYTLPDGKNYYWEEIRTTEGQYTTQYRYRDLPIQNGTSDSKTGTESGIENFLETNVFSPSTFKDISGWYYENVAAVYRLGLMRGVGDSRFAPDDNVTIAEAVTMAARMHNIYYGNGEKFEPYDGGNWYDPYVNYVKKNGLLAENYDYNKPATREQFAHILACAFPNEALAPLRSSSASFADAGSIVYRGDVNRLYMAGVINGSLDGGVLSFKPQDTITRAEAAAIVTRMAKPELRVS